MKLYVYDDEMHRIGVKERGVVHHDGSWHRGVQLNIFCADKLLIQQRSFKVDIAKGLYDQSLATQLSVEDGEDETLAISRGLQEELGLVVVLSITHIAGPVKIIKTYDYDKSLLNREFVSLYQIRVPQQLDVTPNLEKVLSVQWLPLNLVKLLASEHPERFSKTFLMWLAEVM